MNPRNLLTALVVAVAFYVSFVIMDDATLLQQSLVFSTSVFVYLVIFYRKGLIVMTQQAGHRFYTGNTKSADYSSAGTVPPISQAKKLPDEIRIINRWFVKRGFSMQANDHVQTPDYECYNLVKTSGATWSALTEKSLSDLAYAIFEYRGGGDPVKIVFNEQPAFLRVTAKERKVLSWSARVQGLEPLVGQVGAYLNGTTLRPVKVNLTDPKEWFAGIFSSSGGGKSNVLKCLVLSAIENADPANTEVFFIDLDSDQFDRWLDLPQVKYVAKTENEALWLLDHLVKTVEGNRNLSNTVRRILVVDELQMLTARSDYAEDFQEKLGTLAERWRKHGGNMLLSTQDPTGKNYPTALQRNTKVVFAGLTEDDSYLKTYLGVEGADSLRGDGDFLMKGAGKQINFKAFMLTDKDIDQTIAAIVNRWGKGGDKLAFDWSDEGFADETNLPPSVRPKRSQVELDAEVVASYLDEAYDSETGKLKNGWGVKLLQVLYGEPKANAGNYKKRLDAAVELALTNLTNRET